MIDKELANMRRNYTRHELVESTVSTDPFVQFAGWMNDAIAAGVVEPNAMTLATVATVNASFRATSRVVLLKGFDERGFVFFTNYESRKGRALALNPYANLHFFWLELERQVNISGPAEKISAGESDEYFASRPFESRIGAWASRQSEVIDSREILETRVSELKETYANGVVPRPPYWGGYRVRAERFEFWQGRADRLHDRIRYIRQEDEPWRIDRLSP